ncbi:MAG TPA: hypothetical protein PKD53_24145 [Chloroflexaceae bacterium]|nr:hypothetical protein [Chloroflexaceae bacterium]
MEQEIDLRPYLQAFLRQWRLVVAVAAVLCLLAVVATLLLPRAARARGDVLVVARTSQLALDPRFTERDATMVTSAANQRQALIDLASSPELETRVAAQLGLNPDVAGQLGGRVTVTARSDLLQFEASGTTNAEALELVEAWARGYEDLVSEVYTRANPEDRNFAGQIADAQTRYDEARQSLAAFYGAGDLVRAEQQVLRLEGLLKGGSEAQVSLYTNYLTRTQELSLILEDARSLQAQYVEGGADLGAGLAALAVRTRVAGDGQLPVQLSFASAESFAQDQATTADLARFVQVLEGERDRMVAQAEALAGDLATGDTSAIGLPPELRERYEQELSAARGALAETQAQETLLLQQQTVALKSLEVLQAKRDEIRIAQAAPDVSVRYVGKAPEPPRSIVSSLVLNAVLATMLGLILGSALAIGRVLVGHLARQGPAGAPVAPRGERPADKPVASD